MITLSEKIRFIERFLGSARLAANSKNCEVRCPVCDPRDHTKKKLSIRLSDDAYHCWVCNSNGRSLLFLLKKFGTQELLYEYLNVFKPELRRSLSESVENDKPQFKLPGDFKLLVTCEDTKDPDIALIFSYLKARNVSKRDFWYFRIGISDQLRWFRRALVPSFDLNGHPNYLVGRTVEQKRFPKYNTSFDVEKRNIVFNELNIDWSKRLVICEGVFDIMKCPENSVPLLGSSLNEQSLLFEKIVTNQTPIVLALDADMKYTNTQTIAKKLMSYDISVKVVDLETDPGDMSKQQVLDAVEVAHDVDWLSYINARLFNASRQSLAL